LKAQAILLKYGINPANDLRNLVWAPNWGHSEQYVLDVVAALVEADANASKFTSEAKKVKLIEATLRELAEDYIHGERWPRKVVK